MPLVGKYIPTLHHLTIYRTSTALTEKKNVMILKLKFLISEKLNTGESSEFVVVQFSWYLWVALTHEFAYSTKANYKRF